MPGPVRIRETFSQGAGYDLGAAWTPGTDGGSGSVDPDHPSQPWNVSIYPNDLRVINAAGNNVNTGQAFAVLALSSTQDNDSIVFGYGVESHTLGASQGVGSFVLLDATLAVPMFLGALQTDGSSNLFATLISYATGVAVTVPTIGVLSLGTQVQLRWRFGININGPNVYTASVDDGLGGVQSISVTDVARQTTRLGAVLFGNTSRALTVNPATQVYSYLLVGDVAPAARLSRLRSSVVPALAALSFMGHLFRRVGTGLWLPTMRLPELPALGVI